jgi:hypothetical protein
MMVEPMMIMVVMVTMLLAVLQRVLRLILQALGIDPYRRGVGIVGYNRTSIVMVIPVMIMVVVTMLFAVLQRVLRLILQALGINSYGGGVSIVGGNRTSIMMVVSMMIMVVMVTVLFAALQRVLGLKFLQVLGIDPYCRGVGIAGCNRTSIMMVEPMMIMVVVVVTMLFAVLQRVLRLILQVLGIDPYRRGISIAGCNCTSIMMVEPMMIMVMVTVLFAALQRVLGLKLQASEINSYHRGASIAGENRTPLEGSSNSDTNEGKSNNTAKHSELCKCLS